MASVGVALLMLTSMLNAAFAFGESNQLALIMGGTGAQGGSDSDGTPTDDYIANVVSRYINPTEPFFAGQPVFPGFTPVPLVTPEQDDTPATGDLTLAESIARGVTNLDTALTETYIGNQLVVFGYSQSATLARLEIWKYRHSAGELAGLANTVPGIAAVHDLPLPRGRGPLFDRLLQRTQQQWIHKPLRRWVGLNFPTIATLALPGGPCSWTVGGKVENCELAGESQTG